MCNCSHQKITFVVFKLLLFKNELLINKYKIIEKSSPIKFYFFY